MNFLHLQYFKKVAEYEHVTKAAADLMISQSSLTRAIQYIEEELECPLFDRKGKNIVLNKNGKIFLRYTDFILDAMDQMKREIRKESNGRKKAIHIYVPEISDFLSEPFLQFGHIHPNLEIHIEHFQKDQLLQGRNELHIVKTSCPLMSSEILFTQSFFLCLPPNEKSSEKEYINKASLLIPETETYLQELVSDFCSKYRFTPKIITQYCRFEELRKMVNAGFGMAFLPLSVIHRNDASVHVTEYSLAASINLISSEILSEEAAELRDYLINYFYYHS